MALQDVGELPLRLGNGPAWGRILDVASKSGFRKGLSASAGKEMVSWRLRMAEFLHVALLLRCGTGCAADEFQGRGQFLERKGQNVCRDHLLDASEPSLQEGPETEESYPWRFVHKPSHMSTLLDLAIAHTYTYSIYI